MNWNINFIKEEDFREHVRKTLQDYSAKFEPYTLEKFIKNKPDITKLLFDKNTSGKSWKEIFSDETQRQRDKTTNNSIGYFNQRLFQFLKDCRVPQNGTEGGWDIIYTPKGGIEIDGIKVDTIKVEMKNKFNTMNDSAQKSILSKMQNELIKDDHCACFLVEVISKRSQNEPWVKKKKSHRLIRKVSIDRFLELVTGEETAFKQLITVLPKIIEEEIKNIPIINTDTVYEEILSELGKQGIESTEDNITQFLYQNIFNDYLGFKK